MYEDLHVLGRRERREKRPLPDRLETLARFLIAGGTLFLLMGWGEAIVAAPFLLPALWWASRSARPWSRAGFALLAGLVMIEVGWLIAYTTSGERSWFHYVAPALGFVGTIAIFVLRGRTPSSRPDPSVDAKATRSSFDVVAALALLFAASLSAASLGFMTFFDGPVPTGWFAAGAAGAWMGFEAWRHGYWLLAAGSFLVSLAWPAGFYRVLTGPIAIAFVVVCLVRAARDAGKTRGGVT